ncbi:MAG: AmmeMemoRadiSam system protein B [Ignavibacteriales bacterium]|nr:AmmeMemoRadiSam system protein B [Ignavibacteriales bacterium]
MPVIRDPAVAGLFYPQIKSTLSSEVDDLLLRAPTNRFTGLLRGLICPHAGYMYSGLTAAAGYKLLKDTAYEAIVIVGPSHREYFDSISVYPGDAYKTPLGDVSVHEGIRSALVAFDKKIALSDAGHHAEHSVEVQLPFLQRVFKTLSFVPIVMGDQRREYCELLARALDQACHGHNVLLVASSDLSHYHPQSVAVRLDRSVIDEVEQYDPARLMSKLEEEQVEACGGGPMVAVMHAARKLGAGQSKVLSYCNSGDVTGEKDAVVGYLSAAFIQEQ